MIALNTKRYPGLQFAKLDSGEFIPRLSPLMVFAVLIERTVEILLTIWSAQEAYKREADVQQFIRGGKPSDDTELEECRKN